LLGASVGVWYAIAVGFQKAVAARANPGVVASLTKIDSFPLFTLMVCPGQWGTSIQVSARYVESLSQPAISVTKPVVSSRSLIFGVARAEDCWQVSSSLPLLQRDAASGYLTSSNGASTTTSRSNFQVTVYAPNPASGFTSPILFGLYSVGQDPTTLPSEQITAIPSGVNKVMFLGLSSSAYNALKPYFFSPKRLTGRVSNDPDYTFFDQRIQVSGRVAEISSVSAQSSDATTVSVLNFFAAGCNWIQTVQTEFYTYDDNDAAQNLFTYLGMFTGTVIPLVMSSPSLLELIASWMPKRIQQLVLPATAPNSAAR
jgi:hypothetical protein